MDIVMAGMETTAPATGVVTEGGIEHEAVEGTEDEETTAEGIMVEEAI